ncbi:MAG: heme ABC exporter ATP-binding protein CcmA [Thermoguttaceae bacterium]|jgi:heme ABC exporter ATP-binding subunit CcmA
MNTNSHCIAIDVNRLTHRYGSRIILNNLHLEIAVGESVAIAGANGSGKTTLLRCMAGLARIQGGEVRWFGRPAADPPASRSLVGMAAHDGFLYPHLSARENLVFAARMHAVSNPSRQADCLLQAAGLEPYAFREARKLSRGMRQRLSILRAIIHDPKILILDEPFAALDVAGMNWLGSTLQELRRRGCTLCFTTHDLLLAKTHADRVLELCGGVLEAIKKAEEPSPIFHPFSKAA